MGRKPCCAKDEGLNRGAWTALEDKILVSYIQTHGEGKWRNLPRRAGLKRCGKSCRLRWLNYLRPDIKRGNISDDEEELIIRLHKLLGNRWSLIAGRLPGRTDNEIKNYWNTTLGKRVHGQSSQSSKGKNPITMPLMIDGSPPKANVIRTKAMKCIKAFFPLEQHHVNSHQPRDLVPKETGSPSETQRCNDSVGMDMDSRDMGVACPLESPGFSQAKAEGIQVGDSTTTENEYSTSLGMPPDDLVMFEDSFGSECFQLDIELDFHSLASFLDLEIEWF